MMTPSSNSLAVVPEIGRYRLIAELARGGMGNIFLAVSQGLAGFNKLLVVKELKPELSEDETFVSMFLDEARLAARLIHPNVVQTNDFGSEGNRHYMLMEFLDGRSLHHVIRRFADDGAPASEAKPTGRASTLPLGAHLRVLCDALLGLHYAHELKDFDGAPLGIVHRDVSPLNVFVTFDGQTKVVDFGIAKTSDSSLQTKTGVLKGRVAYMAPEQAWGGKIDRRADIYSIGVMLWEAVAGRRLWKGLTEVQILSKIMREGAPRLREACEGVPEALDAICARAMEREPDERYATAQDMFEDLEAVLATRSDALSMREVGGLVARAFAEERKKMTAVIEEALTRVRNGPRSGVMPTLEAHFATGGSEPRSASSRSAAVSGHIGLGPTSESSISIGRIGSIAALPSFSPSAFAPSAAPRVAMVPPEMHVRGWTSKRIAAAVAGACVLVVGIIVGVTAIQMGPKRSEIALAEAVPRLATAPVREEAELVDLVVRVTPSSAQITIDGTAVATNPFHGRYAKDGQIHHVMAAAEGFDPKIDDVSFSGDVSVDVSLDRSAGSATRPRPYVAPPTAPAAPPTPVLAHATLKRGGPLVPLHAAADVTAAPVQSAAPIVRAPVTPPPAAPQPDISPTGGHVPLHPIATNNPYGTP